MITITTKLENGEITKYVVPSTMKCQEFYHLLPEDQRTVMEGFLFDEVERFKPIHRVTIVDDKSDFSNPKDLKMCGNETFIRFYNDLLAVREPKARRMEHSAALQDGETCVNVGDARIKFSRTLRIPDNGKEYPLPAGLGCFPLFSVNSLSGKLPPAVRRVGGVVLPMYQKEAMFMYFTTSGSSPCALKVSVGNVNAITGSTLNSGLDAEKQDYCVIPKQPWLDGVCTRKGVVRQFVAIPLGEGKTVEEQVTGRSDHGGIQLEVFPLLNRDVKVRHGEKSISIITTPSENDLRAGDVIELIFKEPLDMSTLTLGDCGLCDTRREYEFFLERKCALHIRLITGKSFVLHMDDTESISAVMTKIGDREGIPPDQQRLIYAGKQLEDDRMICDYGIQSGATLHLVLRLRGGARDEPERMGIALGGKIKQNIYKDDFGPQYYDQRHSVKLFVHILNTTVFSALTDLPLPSTPITAETYKSNGYPWFELYNESAPGVKGSSILRKLKSLTVIEERRDSDWIKCSSCLEESADFGLDRCGHAYCKDCLCKLGRHVCGVCGSSFGGWIAIEKKGEIDKEQEEESDEVDPNVIISYDHTRYWG
eukprot:TRINITY_DN59_c1_g1_i1.p1 TRINITY_DN59_c1_g1~~TRINITY_DN59_c1_g1_i1.p1  ORF type:complete len:595 (+),score=143.95 TRINITY_DN59_c1_g1_i1:129-1913(+)